MQNLTIGRLAEAAGSDVETIRYYERRGLIPEPPRGRNGYRRYPASAVARLRFIQRSKTLGFSLAEIGDLLRLQDANADRGEIRAMTRQKQADLDQRIADLQRMRAVLADLEERCTGHGPAQSCPIIEALNQDASPEVPE
jgi:MerR family mercuric resistance operon transcriptional regulator